MSFQDFDAARRERQRALESVVFQLGDRRFECVKVPKLSDAFELAMAPEARKFDGTPDLAGVRAILAFVEALVVPKQRKAFRKVLASEDIDTETVIELGEWLAEQYAGRPTLRSSGSSDGQPSAGATSNSSRFEPAEHSTT